MIEGIMFLVAISFLTLLAFVLILMYFNIIKINIEKKFKINMLTKEERKMYGWLKFDFDFNIRGKKFEYKSKKKKI